MLQNLKWKSKKKYEKTVNW